jgi:hypothetical protein
MNKEQRDIAEEDQSPHAQCSQTTVSTLTTEATVRTFRAEEFDNIDFIDGGGGFDDDERFNDDKRGDEAEMVLPPIKYIFEGLLMTGRGAGTACGAAKNLPQGIRRGRSVMF